MMHVQQILKEYLELHGYWVLFIGTFLEGEAILLLAGFLAFRGYLDVFGVICTASVSYTHLTLPTKRIV